jgi:hypothetical protein
MHDGWSRFWGLKELFIGLHTSGGFSLHISKITKRNNKKIKRKIKTKLKLKLKRKTCNWPKPQESARVHLIVLLGALARTWAEVCVCAWVHSCAQGCTGTSAITYTMRCARLYLGRVVSQLLGNFALNHPVVVRSIAQLQNRTQIPKTKKQRLN